MKLMEKFNNSVNNNTEKRYTKWSSYREEISNFIKVNSKIEDGKILILGAGNLDDIDLNFLNERASMITLADIDIASINNGLSNYSFHKKNIETIRVEFTGFEKDLFFTNLHKVMLECKSFECIQKFIDKELMNKSEYKFLKDYIKTFDLIIISPIYTQLLYHQFLHSLSILRDNGVREDLIKYAENYLLFYMPNIIDRFNSNIVELLNDDGELFALSDIFEVYVGSDFYKKYNNDYSNENADAIYDDYVENYGIGLGDYGLLSLEDYVSPKNYKWLLWPFNDEVNMVVKVVSYKK